MRDNFFFEYIYYRLYRFYFKWDGRNGITAIIGVSMIQVLLIIDLLAIIGRLFFTRQETHPYSRLFGYVAIGVMMLLMLYNYFRYYNKYGEYKKRWSQEKREVYTKKGFYVVVSLLLPWVILILIAIKFK